MKYQKLRGYDYRLYEQISCQTGFSMRLDRQTEPGAFETPYFKIWEAGIITGYPGYAWDGASCFPDFDWIKEPSAFHDMGYQAGRMGVIGVEYRDLFDRLLEKQCREKMDKINSKMPRWMAGQVYNAVHLFAGKCFTRPNEQDTEVLEAP